MLCMIAFEVKSLCRFESLQAIIFHSSDTFPLGTFHFLSASPPPLPDFSNRGVRIFSSKQLTKFGPIREIFQRCQQPPSDVIFLQRVPTKVGGVGIPPVFRGHRSVCINRGLTVFGFTRILMNIIVQLLQYFLFINCNIKLHVTLALF